MLRPFTGIMQYSISLQRMYNKMQHRTRIELSQFKNEKVRECYNTKLANDMAKIDPAENLVKHAKKTETAI